MAFGASWKRNENPEEVIKLWGLYFIFISYWRLMILTKGQKCGEMTEKKEKWGWVFRGSKFWESD